MGYHISSLGTLAVQPEVELYIFVINGDFSGPHFKALQDAFRSIASGIGDKSAIVEGLSAEFSGDVCRQYLDEDIRCIWDALPALLITDAHPKAITGRTLRLFAPLVWAQQEFGSLETFFRGLVAFAHTRDRPFWNTSNREMNCWKQPTRLSGPNRQSGVSASMATNLSGECGENRPARRGCSENSSPSS